MYECGNHAICLPGSSLCQRFFGVTLAPVGDVVIATHAAIEAHDIKS